MITRRKSGQVGGTPPAACWAIPGFQAEHDALFGESRQLADDLWGTADASTFGCTDDMTKQECTDQIFDVLRTNLMAKYGCENIGPGTPVAGAPCDSFENKYAVQVALRGMGLYADTLDGKWGKNSQAALDQSGMTFEQLAPGCTPPAPKYTGSSTSGGGSTTTGGGGSTTTGGGGTNVGAGEGSESSNMWMWGVGAAVILGLGAAVVLTKKKQPYATNPVRLNDSDREDWIRNDEGLHSWWKSSRLPMRQFIRENRAEIDAVILPVLSGNKKAHHLIYG